MRMCVPCFLASGQDTIEVEDLVSIDDTETPCESELHDKKAEKVDQPIP